MRMTAEKDCSEEKRREVGGWCGKENRAVSFSAWRSTAPHRTALGRGEQSASLDCMQRCTRPHHSPSRLGGHADQFAQTARRTRHRLRFSHMAHALSHPGLLFEVADSSIHVADR